MIVIEDHARSIFLAALERAPDQWPAFLDEACADKPELRARVNQLLDAHQALGSIHGGAADLPSPLGGEPQVPGQGEGAVATIDEPITERPGTVIGPYKLMEQIGEGGMGLVFVAEQTQPVRRKVALKVIKPGMDTRQVIARFEAERQALALMDHPNIAKVLDGGETATGRPYFVMELVKGIPITEYCDQNQVPIRQRLELFLHVCQAVQHAHQKGIIHRDIKPSNVLILSQDGTPVVKVIDFGVAKAVGQQLTDKTLYTQFTQLIGTPLYMSPEQAGQSGVDVDTRSDIYSLGVLLYELLTGTTPFDKQRLKDASYDELRRIIREEEPAKPSTRISTLGQAATTASTNRKSDPKRLSRLFRGELDWIVMKALEKDRNRRYETANAFATDVQRYLHDEPVQACPPSARYRLQKFVRRNKATVMTVAIVLVVLVGGIVGTGWGLVRAQRSTAAEKEANALTRKRLAQIEKSNEIIGGIFEDLDIVRAKNGTQPFEAVLAEHLVKAAEQLEGDSVGDPLEVAALQERLGSSLISLGFPDRAIPILEKCCRTRQEALGDDYPDTVSGMGNLALGYQDAGKLDRALQLWEENFQRAKAIFGPDRRETLSAMSGLAQCYLAAMKIDLALPLFEETLKLQKAKLGVDHRDTLKTMNDLAVTYDHAGKLDLALALQEETFKLDKAKYGPDDPSTLASMGNLATAYRHAGKLDLALSLNEECVQRMKAKLPPDHPSTLVTMNNLALGYKDTGKLDLAVPLFEETVKRMKAKLGPDHPNTLRSMGGLASSYQKAGKLDLALPLTEETLTLKKAKHGPDHADTLIAMNDLAVCYWSLRQLDKSIPLFEDLLKRQEAKLGRQHPEVERIVANLGINYLDAGRRDAALPLLEEAYAASRKYPALRFVGLRLLDEYTLAGKKTEARALFRELLADARRELAPASPQLAGKLAQLGAWLLNMKEFTEAESILRESFTIREKKEPDLWTTFNSQSLLGGALLGQKNYAAAEPLLLAGFEGMKKREKAIPPLGQVRLPEAVDRLVELYTVTNKPDDLKKWQAERTRYTQNQMSVPPQKK